MRMAGKTKLGRTNTWHLASNSLSTQWPFQKSHELASSQDRIPLLHALRTAGNHFMTSCCACRARCTAMKRHIPVRPNSIYRELRKEAGLYVRHVHLCTGMHRCTFCQIRCQGHDIVVNRSLVHFDRYQKKLERLSCRLVSGMPGAINDCSIPPSWSNFLIKCPECHRGCRAGDTATGLSALCSMCQSSRVELSTALVWRRIGANMTFLQCDGEVLKECSRQASAKGVFPDVKSVAFIT